MIVHKDNVDAVGATLGFPCVLKRPDSSFSAGVVKAENEEELQRFLAVFFEDSELVVAQEFAPSQFDWRIGILDGKPLYACKYHMARGHWQVQKAHGPKQRSYGKVETLPIADAPTKAVKLALRAANFIGRGFYGVDVKQRNGKFLLMEVNDNPNIEAGAEDAVLKDDLYLAVMRVFRERLDRAGNKASSA
jgi:glutathione synthase/RimK-type ligase-like ATP-grasp enzyme